MVFGVQKVGFCIAKVWFLFFKRVFFVLQYTIPCPRISTKWRCNSYHFDTSKPFGSDCKTGAMNRTPTPCGVFAAIYLRNKWILRNVRCHTFALPISLFLFILPHVSPRPPRRRRGPIYRTVPKNTHKMALQFVIFRTSRQIEKREKQTHDVCFSLVFYVLN